MELVLAFIQIGVGICTMALMSYTLWRMIALTAESRAARTAAVAASGRAEQAAILAASHAADTAQIIVGVGVDIKELTLNTNSLKDALVASTAKASDLEGEKRGREQEVARVAEEAKGKAGEP